MSVQRASPRTTAPEISARKGGEPIVSLTAYHAHTAAIADPHVDFLLVGDSLGMVMHGFETTLPVPLELMIMHGRAVMRGSKRALVVVDMPFGSYEESPSQAFHNAAKVIKETQCGAIKLEGGAPHGRDHSLSDPARHSGDGPYRPYAAIDQRARRLQDARTHPRPMGGDRERCRGRGRGRRLCRRARGDGRAAGAPITERSPSRPSASVPRPIATARSWSWRTCSACRPGCRNSSRNSARWARRSSVPSATMPRRCGRATSPLRSTPTMSRTDRAPC